MGETDLPAHPVEQGAVQLLLQGGDALAYGGLGQVQALAGGGKRAGFGDGDKGLQVLGIHKLSVYPFQNGMQ